ncbi:hypothetical protein H4582DRAFT_1289478 [Lactarius indigo]|nr:hypothetical protein H4582DRAFT_1289478 [Lactarius indigo]
MEFLHLRPPSHCRIHSPSLSLPDQPDQQHTRFPTSSDRLGRPATSIHRPPFDRLARYDPLGRLSQDKHYIARKSLCSSFVPRFFPSSVARGVLSDGTWTTEHPCVNAFLQSPYSRPSLTSTTSAAIYSLAALHVFYSPSHPSYDVFWHPDIKESTAIFVHGVVTMKPSPISTTPMTWLGVHDMLWQLTGIQKEYAKSQGIKATTSPPAPTRRSLRKRKPVQALLQALEEREPSEVPEPPRKKARKSKSDENEKGAEATPQPGVSAENEAGPSALSHTKSTTLPSPLEVRATADTTPSPLTITSSLPSDSQPTAKDDIGSSRGHSKDTASKKTPATQTASRTSRRTRERSPSFSSGSSTAVSAAGSSNSKRARSSSSVSSTSTTVGAETGSKGKGKGKEKAAAEVAEDTEEEETDDEAGKRSAKSKRPTAKEAPPKSSRKQSGGTTKRSPEDIDKLAAAEAPRRVRKRSRVTSSRSRKARKS